MSHRYGPNFRRIFAAAILQEVGFMLLIHFPGHLERLGATESRIGLLYAAAAALGLLSRPAFGKLLDLTSRRTILLVVGVANALLLVGIASTSGWGPPLWVLFLLLRAAQIALFTAMLTYSADSLPLEHRTRGLAVLGLSGLVPIAFGGMLGDLVVDHLGFDALFLLSASAGLASWSIVWSLPPLSVAGDADQPRRSFWAAVLQPNLLPLWWATLCFSAGLETLFVYMRVFVEDRQIGSTGMFFAVYGISAAAVRLLGGPRYDRLPHRPFVVAALGAYSLGLTLLALAGSVPTLLGAALVCGVAHGGVFPILSSQIVARARVSERGSAMSTFTSIFDISLLAAAPTVGLLIEASGYGTGFGSMAALLGVGAVVYAVWDRRLVAGQSHAAAG